MQPIRSTKVYSADGLCGWHDGFTGFYLVVSGIPEHVRKQQEAERKFQEAEQQRRYQEIANLLAEMRAQNQQWSSHHARAPKFPQLDSDDLEEWCCRAEEYFAYHRTPDEYRVSLSTFHLEGPIRKMQWFQDIRWSKRVTTWDEFVRILHTRYSVPEKVEERDNFKNEDEEKDDDAATQTITPESVPDSIEDIEYTKIIPEISESARDHKFQIPTINSVLEKIESLDQVKAGVAEQSDDEIDTDEDPIRTIISNPVEIPALFVLSQDDEQVEREKLQFALKHTQCAEQHRKTSNHYLSSFVSPYLTGVIVVVALLKHRWRWKCVVEEANAAAEADAPTCHCRRSRAGQRTGGQRIRVGGGRLGPEEKIREACSSNSARWNHDEGQKRQTHKNLGVGCVLGRAWR